MPERMRLKPSAEKRASAGGNYFAAPKKREFIKSGCKLLDLVLGGGWAEGRIANIIGDKSTGKTLLCIEAAANFIAKYPDGLIKYRETEAAFDQDYAAALGMPIEAVDFGEPLETVEDLFEDMEAVLESAGEDQHILYIVDSLDALSDREELNRAMDKGSYGTNKPKKIGELFRRLVRRMERANMTVLIVSQVRSKIGVTFGERNTRSGGRALDFYASQFIKLAHIQVITQTKLGSKRAVGVTIRAKSTKNKIGLPFRECEFDILFGYGIDDLDACLRWLDSTGRLKQAGYAIVGKARKGAKKKELDEFQYESLADLIDEVWQLSEADFRKEMRHIRGVVDAVWWEIEEALLPKRRKY